MRIALLDVAMSVDAQIVGALPPRLQDAADALVARLGLNADEVVANSLVACGMGQEPSADEVAACSARFIQQQSLGKLELVVFMEPQAYGLAGAAGLLDGDKWSPFGWASPVPVLIAGNNLDEVVAGVAAALGLQDLSAPVARTKLKLLASRFLVALPAYRSYRVLGDDGWKTRPGRITVKQMRAHLAGKMAFGAHSPVAPWPFIVLDIDRHDALQAKLFEQTVRSVRKLFPGGYYVRSSSSGGVHVYLKLPPDIQYFEAVLFMRAYVNIKEARWYIDAKVMSELVEVPDQPPRLPFGPGSSALDPTGSFTDQVHAFLDYIESGSTDDYTAAADAVWLYITRGKDRRFTPAVQRRLKELGAMPEPPVHVTLSKSDPWSTFLGQLPADLRAVAAAGVPAYGSRTLYTRRLIQALPSLVDEDEAVALIEYWILARRHVSKDIASSMESVIGEAKELVRQRYAKGLPVRAWQYIQLLVQRSYFARQHGLAMSVTLQILELTAFNIAMKFFVDGVGQRPVPSSEFGAYVQDRFTADVRQTLEREWLLRVDDAIPGERATVYRLAPGLWPLRPGEPVLHHP